MKVISTSGDKANVEVSSLDFHILGMALAQSFESLDKTEYSIRMGCTWEEARKLFDDLRAIELDPPLV